MEKPKVCHRVVKIQIPKAMASLMLLVCHPITTPGSLIRNPVIRQLLVGGWM